MGMRRYRLRPAGSLPDVKRGRQGDGKTGRGVHCSLPLPCQTTCHRHHCGACLSYAKCISVSAPYPGPDKLCTWFALLALLLTSIGLYGVMTYNVARATHEIGVRMALGAQNRKVQWMILRESLLLLGIGVLLGLPATMAATRLVGTQLFGLTPSDPPTFITAILAISMVALLAAYFPARRASRVDPMVALRDE